MGSLKTPTTAKKAEATMRYFEDQGRKVSSVSIKGTEISIDFAPDAAPATNAIDLVNMGE